MKKKLLVCVLTLYGHTLFSQEVVSSQGNSHSNSSGSIHYTIGETVIATGTNGTNDITQGFHQTNWNFVGLEDHSPNYTASVFPNPTQEQLNIQTSQFDNVSYTLFDALGKKVIEGNLEDELTALAVADLAPGSYSLVLSSENETLKVFKLVKNQ